MNSSGNRAWAPHRTGGGYCSPSFSCKGGRHSLLTVGENGTSWTLLWGQRAPKLWELSSGEVSDSLKLYAHCSVPHSHLRSKPGRLAASHLEQMAFLDELQTKGLAGGLILASDQEDAYHPPLRSLAQGQGSDKAPKAPLVTSNTTGTWGSPSPGGFGHGLNLSEPQAGRFQEESWDRSSHLPGPAAAGSIGPRKAMRLSGELGRESTICSYLSKPEGAGLEKQLRWEHLAA